MPETAPKTGSATPLNFARIHPKRHVSLLEIKQTEARLARELVVAECRKNHPAGKGLQQNS